MLEEFHSTVICWKSFIVQRYVGIVSKYSDMLEEFHNTVLCLKSYLLTHFRNLFHLVNSDSLLSKLGQIHVTLSVRVKPFNERVYLILYV